MVSPKKNPDYIFLVFLTPIALFLRTLYSDVYLVCLS